MHGPKRREATVTDLIELKKRLRKEPSAQRKAFNIEVSEIAAGYHALCDDARHRKQPYLSMTRNGFAPVEKTGRRREERLAMALFNQRHIRFESGDQLLLIDYQFPLKSRREDRDIGKIDLLGVYDDGTLAVVELKVAGNREDRRIGLLEGLIYAAIVEANLGKIAAEVTTMHGCRVMPVRPKILLAAPPRFWSDATLCPAVSEIRELASEIGSAVPIDIVLLSLQGTEPVDLGLDGTKPTLQPGVVLSPVP